MVYAPCIDKGVCSCVPDEAKDNKKLSKRPWWEEVTKERRKGGKGLGDEAESLFTPCGLSMSLRDAMCLLRRQRRTKAESREAMTQQRGTLLV